MKNYGQTNYFNFSSVRESANRTEPTTEEKKRTVENSNQNPQTAKSSKTENVAKVKCISIKADQET